MIGKNLLFLKGDHFLVQRIRSPISEGAQIHSLSLLWQSTFWTLMKESFPQLGHTLNLNKSDAGSFLLSCITLKGGTSTYSDRCGTSIYTSSLLSIPPSYGGGEGRERKSTCQSHTNVSCSFPRLLCLPLLFLLFAASLWSESGIQAPSSTLQLTVPISPSPLH